MKKTAFTLLFVCFFGLTCLSAQQKELKNIKLDDFISEIQYSSDNPDAIEMVFWLSPKFWEVILSQDPGLTQKDVEATLILLEGYELFTVVKGDVGYFGGITYNDIESILSVFSVIYKGKKLEPVNDSDISPDLLNLISAMKPILANMMGNMGENMHFILMKSPNSNSILPIDPLSEEDLEIHLGEAKWIVDLPLGSLLKEKKCPEDDKMLNGKWFFCPYHGDKLIEQ